MSEEDRTEEEWEERIRQRFPKRPSFWSVVGVILLILGVSIGISLFINLVLYRKP